MIAAGPFLGVGGGRIAARPGRARLDGIAGLQQHRDRIALGHGDPVLLVRRDRREIHVIADRGRRRRRGGGGRRGGRQRDRSEEHTSELQSLMRISYAVFCLKKKKSKTASISTDDT